MLTEYSSVMMLVSIPEEYLVFVELFLGGPEGLCPELDVAGRRRFLENDF